MFFNEPFFPAEISFVLTKRRKKTEGIHFTGNIQKRMDDPYAERGGELCGFSFGPSFRAAGIAFIYRGSPALSSLFFST
jgi:hypothetical protein